MPIELNTAYMRAVLEGVQTRVSNAANVLDWADGTEGIFTGARTDLIPPFAPEAQKAALQDYERYTKQVQTLGPRILRIKRDTAIGEVNWGGDDGQADEALEALDLEALARAAFKPLATNGVVAARAFRHARSRDDEEGEAEIEILGGYLEPIYRDDAIGGRVIGLWQILSSSLEPGSKYDIRLYDFDAKTITFWDNQRTPTEVGNQPTAVIENQPMPRVQVWDTHQDGTPIGELAQAYNLLRGEVAQQIRIKRVSESHAFSLLYMAGSWDDPEHIGTQAIMVSSDPAAKVGRIEPGSLAELFTEHDRIMERLRNDLALPVGFLGTGDFPSGEALDQANTQHITNAKQYARVLSRLLTDVVADYAELIKVKPVPVNVVLNREATRKVISDQTRQDFGKGLIPLRTAVVHISPYYPEWDSDEIEKWLKQEENLPENEPTPSGEGDRA